MQKQGNSTINEQGETVIAPAETVTTISTNVTHFGVVSQSIYNCRCWKKKRSYIGNTWRKDIVSFPKVIPQHPKLQPGR
ncbi:hypothetical protein FF38_06554 [Lucilia cuprina]|uniref:Uncharacterized protein n=1 Tax=Lucilia cuprina TaxID=7375 RepID=A0A0L0C594_LUCCU|nr:hypothetical protein FF38_06554 [Lucilia cuprina]